MVAPEHEFETVKLLQSSMQFSDGRPAQREDAEQVFDVAIRQDVDILGFTETTKGNRPFRALAAEAEERGWWFQDDITGDSRFAANPKNTILEAGYVHVLDGKGGMPSGNYSNRGIAEVTIETEAGNILTDHLAHWLTGFKLDRNNEIESGRERRHEQQTLAMIERVRLHGRGNRLAFWQGDTNVDEEKDTGFDPHAIHALFSEAGLESIYDAVLGVGAELPATSANGKTIDILGHFKLDRRVMAKQVRVIRRRGRNADHLMVLAEYAIMLPLQAEVPHLCTTCNFAHFIGGAPALTV